MRSWIGLFPLAAALMLNGTGCMTRVADMTAISTRNVSLDKLDLDALPQRKVVGEASTFIFLIIPFGIPHLEDAVDDALNKGNGDLMLDASIHMGGWWFLVGQSTLQVRGSVVKTLGEKK